MPLPQTWAFTQYMLAGAPSEAGVFALWDHGEIIYYGRAMGGVHTVRACLLEHLQGNHGRCTQRATHYSWEITLKPAEREAELLEAYRVTNARLPRCNRSGAAESNDNGAGKGQATG